MQRPTTVERVLSSLLESPGQTDTSLRRAVFDRVRLRNGKVPENLLVLLGRIADQPWAVNDEDISQALAAGYSEDQLFELILAAATGAGVRRLDAGLRAMEEAE
ncbi:MAG TPA: hypothetical protein VFR84_16990 [Candidatus Angelobacter sp.]|nr:hypothetical protein [Candidatus Angelobacter sp.]